MICESVPLRDVLPHIDATLVRESRSRVPAVLVRDRVPSDALDDIVELDEQDYELDIEADIDLDLEANIPLPLVSVRASAPALPPAAALAPVLAPAAMLAPAATLAPALMPAAALAPAATLAPAFMPHGALPPSVSRGSSPCAVA